MSSNGGREDGRCSYAPDEPRGDAGHDRAGGYISIDNRTRSDYCVSAYPAWPENGCSRCDPYTRLDHDVAACGWHRLLTIESCAANVVGAGEQSHAVTKERVVFHRDLARNGVKQRIVDQRRRRYVGSPVWPPLTRRGELGLALLE